MRQRPLDAQALDARACFVLVAGPLHAHTVIHGVGWLMREGHACGFRSKALWFH